MDIVISLLTIEHLVSLLMLVLLQAVLGFDNLLYISLESQRAEKSKQAMVRKLGIGIAVVLRIVLLFALMKVIGYFQNPLFHISFTGIIEGTFNLHSIVVLFGGAFILYTASKEILHMLSLDDINHSKKEPKGVFAIIFWIVLMNLVFSFDSILSAMALSDEFIIMAIAIIIGGILMIVLSDSVTAFLQKNRMYEVLGLFILFIVGVMLVSEGGHLAHLNIMGNPIMPMTKTTFYFVIFVLVCVELVQGRYQKKIQKAKAASSHANH